MDAACYAVFQEGYRDGYGADGNHLKHEEDIEYALCLGFTMLKLDCSEKLDNTVAGMASSELEERYAQIAAATR
ncbi:tagaturonate epimerase family protein [Paenibacillus filicis]